MSRLQDGAAVATLFASVATVVALALAAYQFSLAVEAEKRSRDLDAGLWLFQVDTSLTERMNGLRKALTELDRSRNSDEALASARQNLIALDSFIRSVETVAAGSVVLAEPWREIKTRLCPEMLREGYFAHPALGDLLLIETREICRAI